jgi:hypothetical protein
MTELQKLIQAAKHVVEAHELNYGRIAHDLAIHELSLALDDYLREEQKVVNGQIEAYRL